MIKSIVRLGKWLETRFPEKVVVTTTDYMALATQLAVIGSQLKDIDLSLNTALERLSVVETSAVHKEPVKLLVEEVDRLSKDYKSFKASMGFTPSVSNAEIQALINGEPI